MLDVLLLLCFYYWFIDVGVKNSIDIMVKATAVNTLLSSPAWTAVTVVVEMYSLIGIVARVTTNFGPFCSKDLSSCVSSFMGRLITHLSWILEVLEEERGMLKMLVVMEAILEVVVEAVEIGT